MNDSDDTQLVVVCRRELADVLARLIDSSTHRIVINNDVERGKAYVINPGYLNQQPLGIDAFPGVLEAIDADREQSMLDRITALGRELYAEPLRRVGKMTDIGP